MLTRRILGIITIAAGIAFATAQTRPANANACIYLSGQDSKPADVRQYIGVDKCKLCHIKKTTGEAYMVWKKTKHAKAYEVLASPEAKAIGEKLKIEDPQKSDQCMKCHSTGYGSKTEEFAATFKKTEGIGCEACHGPGSEYHKEDVHAKSRDLGKKAGIIIPDEKTCIKCHNKDSPNYKEFDFQKFYKEIAHKNPEKEKK
ncbi:MAG: cytochrome C554 [Planctomycetes bacterium]|nr:cytochrome C554 [Planctomycetota bacterium]